MKRAAATVVAMFACGAAAESDGKAHAWSYQQIGADGGVVEIFHVVSAEASRIDGPEEVVHIDFDRLVLYRYRKADRGCRAFALKGLSVPPATNSGKQVAEWMEKLAAGMEVTSIPEERPVGGNPCAIRRVSFGTGLAPFLTVMPLRIDRYGVTFGEEIVQYCVSREVPFFDHLRELAVQREPFYAANPLLRRIDPLGMITALDGFPVRMERVVDGGVVRDTLKEPPRLTEAAPYHSPPPDCR